MSRAQFDLVNSEVGRYGWKVDQHGLHIAAPSGVHAGTIGLDGLGSCHYATGPQGKKGLGPFKSLEEAGDLFTGKVKPTKGR